MAAMALAAGANEAPTTMTVRTKRWYLGMLASLRREGLGCCCQDRRCRSAVRQQRLVVVHGPPSFGSRLLGHGDDVVARELAHEFGLIALDVGIHERAQCAVV